MTTHETEFNGWKNWETYNVAESLTTNYPLYCIAQGYTRYRTPYLSLRADLAKTFNFLKTKDGADLWGDDLDIEALDDMLREL